MVQPNSIEPAARTIELLTDANSFAEANDTLASRDPLGWPGYKQVLEVAGQRSSASESLVAGGASISGLQVEIAAFDFSFIAGSMGEVAGERLARALERAADRNVPFVLVTSTGGARVQEGMVALVQMPKLVAARLKLADAHQPLIAVLEHPTTGGVLASVAGLADFTAAVDGATIGFAGPRVVERFTGSRLQLTSHTARSAFHNGLVDSLITREERRRWLTNVVSLFSPDRASPTAEPTTVRTSQFQADAWSRLQIARSSRRPTGPELIDALTEPRVELRGDRAGGDDRAIAAVVGRLGGRRVLVIAFDRRLAAGPRAFRKAIRALELAGRLQIPIVTLIDTRGGDPSASSEAGGVAWAIAETIEAILRMPVPVVSIVTGEGGSGGALALAVGDVVLAYESSVFSVIDPEAAAEILWRSGGRTAEVAQLLKLGAEDLVALEIADALIPDPLDPETLKQTVSYHLEFLTREERSGAERVKDRRSRWRGAIGP
jgi:acyl-CoA carboxylase subunit beta